MITFTGENPTLLQLQALNKVLLHGETYAPRGKSVKELRPVCVEFLNPLNRVTFLQGRRINPFFQLAESLWILSGKSDVEFLTLFNKNMKSFSDDGFFFNASYGERLRYYGNNTLHNEYYNPVDQLKDVYLKLKNDKDTRQAVISLTNPHFDNASYTIGEQGKDIACNLILLFKIRNNKLDLSVFNRSNDLYWGLWGANLAQFTTIQEALATFLGVSVGTYRQITDSLHVYTDSYGSSITEDIKKYHPNIDTEIIDSTAECAMNNSIESTYFSFPLEPRMSLSLDDFEIFLNFFWKGIAPQLYQYDSQIALQILDALHTDPQFTNIADDYWKMAISAMFAYRAKTQKDLITCLEILTQYVPNCSWKVSMMYFLKSSISTCTDSKVKELYTAQVDSLSSITLDSKTKVNLLNYLKLD